ncbi:S-adenosyl-L-methionine-dependent methyltransferase [Xylona heveae TC161]|uniref:S-adenosyl-L-methionine-dependent methyltransferase n=1 Tax=Xylona heveae (strain CBS 132557 / TC161) TaxID=1328760 RepID=A0A165HZ86_XYLHT|nr:S-adenosyl-L-methionine-dependent methyltransferase [Xylona heveae TC161]KZF24128.1 S-adenosyl-L-methionine-dependent methyltransferase [Xylona heveae TC161]
MQRGLSHIMGNKKVQTLGVALSKIEESDLDFEYENERRYHSKSLGDYWIPNDEPEIQRLNMQFHCFRLQNDGKLHLAPLSEPPTRVLDIGTGTGIWPIYMGREYPSAEIYATDIAAIQPKKDVPPNVHFIVHDVEKEWPFGEESFDYIHMAMLHGSIADWPGVLQKIKRHLKPGGKVELLELALCEILSDDGTVTPDQAYPRYMKLLFEAAAKRGREVHMGPRIRGLVMEAGFVDVYERINKCPQKPLVGDDDFHQFIGMMHHRNVLSGLEGWAMRPLTGTFGWAPEQVRELVRQVKEEVVNPNIHQYIRMHVVHGTNPRRPASQPVPGLTSTLHTLVTGSLAIGVVLGATAAYFALRLR